LINSVSATLFAKYSRIYISANHIRMTVNLLHFRHYMVNGATAGIIAGWFGCYLSKAA